MSKTKPNETSVAEPSETASLVTRFWAGMRLRSRLSIVLLLLIICTIVPVTYAGYVAVRGAIFQSEFDRFHLDAELLLTRFEMHVAGAGKDVRALATTADVRAALELEDQDAMDRVADRLASLLQAKQSYRSCRLIRGDGIEWVRVDRLSSGAPVQVIEGPELQDKSSRAYFLAAIETPTEQVSVSRIDLNREHGELEVPHVPVIRIASPVEGSNGETVGIVILNVNMTPAFDELRASSREGRRVFLLNSSGDYLVHPMREREFAFEFGPPDRMDESLLRAAPARDLVDQNGEQTLLTSVSTMLAKERGVTLLLETSYETIVAPANAVTRASLAAIVPIVAVGLALAYMFARTLSRPLEELARTANAYDPGTDSFAVPTRGGHEVVELGRSLQVMTEELELRRRTIDAAQSRFRSTVESAPNGILLTDAGGRIVLVNRQIERLFGYRREELIGEPVEILMPHEVRTSHVRDRAAYAKVPSPETREMGVGRELFGLRKDRSRFKLEIGLTPIELDGSTHILASVIDVTERVEARQKLETYAAKLEERNEDLQRFAYVVSHDLKSPLRGIASLASWLKEDLGGTIDADAEENLQLILERAVRLSELIDGILAYSRYAQSTGSPEPVATADIVANVVESLPETGGVQIRVTGTLPIVFFDKAQIHQVFHNLIQNAVTHGAAEGGEVVISCDEQDGTHSFRIWNNGNAIPSQHFQRIFDLFQSLPKADGHKTTGIGLSIVKRIIERNGGTVRVESTPGEGTSFVFTVLTTLQREALESRSTRDAQGASI